MTCGGPKKSPSTSSIVKIILSFRSFEISKGILRNQKIIDCPVQMATVILLYKANLRNIFVSPYQTLFLRCGSVGRNIILFLFSQVLYRLKFVFSCSNIAKT